MPAFTPTFNPLWSTRTFGVEMEMRKESRLTTGQRVSLPAGDVNRALSNACAYPVIGNGNNYASTSGGRAWEVKYDSSAGWEIVTPALRMDEDGHCGELRAGCRALASLRPIVDQSCGLHVHVDCSDFNWQELQRLMAMWMRYEPFFFEMLPSSRHGNHFCVPLRGCTWSHAASTDARRMAGNTDPVYRAVTARNERDFSQAARAGSSTGGHSKYQSLRVDGWWQHGRVEFRLHSATVDYEKIRKWVAMLVTMVQRVKTAGVTTPRGSTRTRQGRVEVGLSTKYVLRMIGMGPTRWNIETQLYRDVYAFCEERRRKFGHARPDTRVAGRRRAAVAADQAAGVEL